MFLLVHYISLPLLERFARTPKHLDFPQKAYHIMNKQGGWQTGACRLNCTLLAELRGRMLPLF